MYNRVIFILLIFITSTITLNSDANDLILSLDEKNALELFKREVKELLPEEFMKTDFYLIRWLRVAELNIRGARNLLLQTVNWRGANNMSEILSEDWSDMELDCPMTFDGVDKDGRPVRSMDAGEWDLRSISLQGRTARLLRYFQYANEKQMQLIFRAHEDGKPVTRFVFLMDAYGINLRQHVTCPLCLNSMLQWYTASDKYYPEFLGEAVVINAPTAAAIGLSTIRPLLSPDTRDRIKVFDMNKKAWMAYLDSRIDKNQRRERYGGTLDIANTI